MTPAELRAEASEADKQADALEAEGSHQKAAFDARAALIRDQARSLRNLADLAEEAEKGLPATGSRRSMFRSKMEMENERSNKRVKIARTMTSDASEAKLALLAAGLTPQDVADSLDVGRSTVNAWCTGARSIPKRYRDRLKTKFKINPAVWPNKAD